MITKPHQCADRDRRKRLMIKGVVMVALRVTDFAASLSFYRDVLGVPLEVDGNVDHQHAEYSFHDPYFHFAIFPAQAGAESLRAHVSFQTENCRELFERAVAVGAVVVEAPRTMPYAGGGTSAVLADPDGNHVELFEPVNSRSFDATLR
jgi:predicted enzyme related to lactoylglutathione lyase